MIAYPLILSVSFLVGCIAYRVRGGGWFTFPNDAVCRLIWGAFGLALPYLALHAQGASLMTYIFAGVLIPLALLDGIVPHAWVQNMGTWPTIQSKWPGFFMPSKWPSPWIPGSASATLHDFLGMMGVGFFRGIFTFVPWAITVLGFSVGRDGNLSLLLGTLLHAAIAIGIITLGAALGYLIGRFLPISIDPSLTNKNPSTWGEFLNGGAWVLALASLP